MIHLEEHIVPGKRLGRHVDHDVRSLAYPARVAPALVTTVHERRSPILDQGDVGSCTGNAMCGLLGTDPHFKASAVDDETLAVHLYSQATHLDDAPGEYPPDDTGSSGLAVAKAAKNDGLIVSYSHAFGLDHALGALVLGPVIIGVPWYSSFDTPGPSGLIGIAHDADVRGGHELEVVGLDVEARTIRIANSWGAGWGDQGFCVMSWDTLAELLEDSGDVVQVS